MKKILIILSSIILIIVLYFIFTLDNTVQIENTEELNSLQIRLPETNEEKKEILNTLLNEETPEVYTEQETNKQLETLEALKSKLENTLENLDNENSNENPENTMSEEELLKLLQDMNL